MHLFTALSVSGSCRRRALAGLLSAGLLLGCGTALAQDFSAGDIAQDFDDPSQEDAMLPGDMPADVPQDGELSPDAPLVEDSGDAIIAMDGISEETILSESELQDELSALLPELEPASADRIRGHLQALLEMESPAGSEGELVVSGYIEERMAALGYTVEEQSFHEGQLTEDGIDPPAINILAERGANAGEYSTQDILLLVTHYDSRRNPEDTDPYANDKTGVAVMLETAYLLSQVETDTDICFVFLSGQEDGNFGAENFLTFLTDGLAARISGVLCVDRVGFDTGMPPVLGTLTGEENDLSKLLQDCGVQEQLQTSFRKGTLSALLDEAREAAPSAAAAALSGQEEAPALLTEGLGLLEDDNLTSAESETEAETPAAPPLAWSLLPDESPLQETFAQVPFQTVTVTQYDPSADEERLQRTRALFPEDAAALLYLDKASSLTGEVQIEDGTLVQDAQFPELEEPSFETQDKTADEAQTETETAQVLPAPDPVLLARTANVVAAAVSRIMQPAW